MAFIFAARWFDRLIGVLSTIILARLLSPEDFGIVAMAMVVIGLSEVLFDAGVNLALIRAKSPSKAHYESAWTIKIIQGVCIAAVIVVAAKYGATYFKEPRLELVLYILACGLLVSSVENIGLVVLQKEMRFSEEFRYIAAKRAIGFFITVALAMELKSYWALVAGMMGMRFAGVILSYFFNPIRPRINFSKCVELMSVSIWLMLKNVSSYADSNLHKVFLGGQGNSGVTGGYTLAAELADMPGTEVLSPINRMLFPLLVKSVDDENAALRIFGLTQGLHLLIVMPLCVGLSYLSPLVVEIVLGSSWMFIAPFLAIMAYFNIFNAVVSASNYYLMALGRFWIVALVSVAQLILFAITISVFFRDDLVEMIAWTRLFALGAGAILSYCLFLWLVPGSRLMMLLSNLFRPLVGCALMYLSLSFFQSHYAAGFGMIASLASSVTLGAIVYVLSVVSLWFVFGRPDGAEHYVMAKIPFLNKKV